MMWQSWACWLGWWTAFLNIFIVLEQLARSPETAETLLPPCLWCCCCFLCVYVCMCVWVTSMQTHLGPLLLFPSHTSKQVMLHSGNTHTCRHINADEQVHAYLLTCTGTPTRARALTSRRTNQQTLKCTHPLRRTHLCTSRRCTAAHTSHLIDDLCEVLEWGSEEGGERVHQMKWICIRWSLK